MTEKHLPLLLQMFKSHVSSELSSIKEYISISETSLSKVQQAFDESMGSDDPLTEEVDNSAYEHYKVTELFPTFFRNSTFTSLFDFFGLKLIRLCWHLKSIKKLKIKPTDITGETDIERAKRYLTIVVGINFDALNVLWSKLKDYQKIRKCIVHFDANIMWNSDAQLESQPLYKIIKGFTNISLSDHGNISISNNKFLIDYIEAVKDFNLSLINIIKDQVTFD